MFVILVDRSLGLPGKMAKERKKAAKPMAEQDCNYTKKTRRMKSFMERRMRRQMQKHMKREREREEKEEREERGEERVEERV